MSHATTLNPAFSPLDLANRPLTQKAVAVVLGTIALAIASRIEVPMLPVPITMQTFAVTMIGALYGWRLGTLTVLAWLGEAMMGLPVLASGKAGLAPFFGPTAGYLLAFPLMAALTGFLAERGWNGKRMGLAFVSMLAGNLLCIAIGGAVLAAMIGGEKGLALGVTPFLLGAVLKSGLAAMTLRLLARNRDA